MTSAGPKGVGAPAPEEPEMRASPRFEEGAEEEALPQSGPAASIANAAARPALESPEAGQPLHRGA